MPRTYAPLRVGIDDAGHRTFWALDGADPLNVIEYGAVGDGVTDDTAAIQAALTAAAGKTLLFPPSSASYRSGRITLPDNHVHILGYGGATIEATGADVFYRRTLADGTGRGYLTKIEGLTFTGTGYAFHYDAAEAVLPLGTQYHEYEIVGNRFLQNAGAYALFFHGAREGVIERNYFQTNQGIYADYTINMDVIGNDFKNTTYGVRYFSGSEGLKIIGGTMLGVGYGVWAGTNVAGVQIVGAMIDYCDNPVLLDAIHDGLITGSYISTRTSNPAIHVKTSAGQTAAHVRIVGNSIYTHHQAANRVVRFDDADDIVLSSNAIGYWHNGVEYSNTTNLKIHENNLRLMSGATGQYSIVASASQPNVQIHRNIVDKPIIATGSVQVSGNIGANNVVMSADRGDTSQTLTARVDHPIQRWATTLSANRTVTLSTTGAIHGDTFRVVRTGLGAFTLDVGGLKTIASATAAFVDVAYDGSAWVLTGYGAL